MLPHRTLLAGILVASLFAAGCKQVVKTIGELQVLHTELTKKFGDEVNVHVQESGPRLVLTVSFINSLLNEKTQPARFKRAAEAAKVVTTHYPRINSVSAIWVGFVRRQTRMLVFHRSEGLDFYPFDRNAQLIQPTDTTTNTSGVPLETSAHYSRDINQSNVFAYGIQLEGEPGKDGVTVLPNFKTTGDVNEKRGPPPKTVQFDFASYSATPRFEQVVPITFVADGNTVLQTKGTFHGNDAQFCYLPVPYAAFRKMITAKQVTIKLGDKQYRLTPSQFEALRKMSEYVTE